MILATLILFAVSLIVLTALYVQLHGQHVELSALRDRLEAERDLLGDEVTRLKAAAEIVEAKSRQDRAEAAQAILGMRKARWRYEELRKLAAEAIDTLQRHGPED